MFVYKPLTDLDNPNYLCPLRKILQETTRTNRITSSSQLKEKHTLYGLKEASLQCLKTWKATDNVPNNTTRSFHHMEVMTWLNLTLLLYGSQDKVGTKQRDKNSVDAMKREQEQDLKVEIGDIQVDQASEFETIRARLLDCVGQTSTKTGL